MASIRIGLGNMRLFTKYQTLKNDGIRLKQAVGTDRVSPFSTSCGRCCDKNKSERSDEAVYPGHIETNFVQKVALSIGSGTYRIVWDIWFANLI